VPDYRQEICGYCHAETWCWIRQNGKPQCPACEVERFFERGLFPVFGYKMPPWIRKVLRDVYGTLKPDGFRQYRRVYIEVGKKNYKSTLVGGISAYHLWKAPQCVERYGGQAQKFYGAAAARDQAGIVYEAARDYCKAIPDLRAQMRWLDSSKRILRRDMQAVYAVISADGKVQDGIAPALGMLDEIHRWTTKAAETLFSVLTKGTVTHPEPLTWEITTAGDEYESPLWWAEHEYARQVIEGLVQSDTFYPLIFAADANRIENEPDYWKSREARVAANPSHEDNGGSLKDSALVEILNEAIAKPQMQRDWKRLHLNVPVPQGETPAIELHRWVAGGGPVDLRQWDRYDVERLYREWGLVDQPCVIGLDYAWTLDLASMACVFPPERDEYWRALMFYWYPQDRLPELERLSRQSLREWALKGFIEAVPGREIDLERIKAKVEWASGLFDVREVCFDPWGQMRAAAKQMVDESGYTCVEIRQGYGSMTEPTKRFLGLYDSGKLMHGNNPVLNWNAACLALMTDGNDNFRPVKPDRAKTGKRIDGVTAIIDAIARAPYTEPSTVGVRSI
jgi:phage terminase large subunit-like protein